MLIALISNTNKETAPRWNNGCGLVVAMWNAAMVMAFYNNGAILRTHYLSAVLRPAGIHNSRRLVTFDNI